MSETTVIHVDELDRFPGAVYVGRANPRRGLPASPLANPFRVGAPMLRGDAIRAFHEGLLAHLGETDADRPPLVEALIACRGKPLACWCRRSDEPKTAMTACHADILVELLDRYTDDELRRMGR